MVFIRILVARMRGLSLAVLITALLAVAASALDVSAVGNAVERQLRTFGKVNSVKGECDALLIAAPEYSGKSLIVSA